MSEIRSIGILGGGQLGRMLSVAASRLGIRCHIFEPGAAPAGAPPAASPRRRSSAFLNTRSVLTSTSVLPRVMFPSCRRTNRQTSST